MGLEIAAFLMQVEEELGLEITDSDLDEPKAWTVGDMVGFIEKKIREKETEEIISEHYPLVVAEEMKKTLRSYSPSGIAPETLMSEIFPESKTWDQFLDSDDSVALEIESAVSTFTDYQRFVKISLALFAFFALTLAFALSFLLENPGNIVMSLLLVPVFGYIWRKISLRILFGLNAKSLRRITFADLVQRVTEERRRHVKNEGRTYRYYTREEIEQLVIKIISDVTAMKTSKITLDKTLVRDLRMG